MPTPTTRMGLLKPTTADPFSTADIASNWQKIDDAPGTYVCTSTTRPPWNAAQRGRKIHETDTLLNWTWDGANFQRDAPRGLLKTTSGAWARGQRTTDITTTSFTGVVAASISNVVVPDGRRTLMVTANFSYGYNPNGHFYVSINRSNVNAQGPTLATWLLSGANLDQGQGSALLTYEAGGLPAGAYNWSFQVYCGSAEKGTATVAATATSPIEIAVIEI